MFEVSVRGHFSAAHRLKGYAGECAGQHGHNWEVEVHVRGGTLSETGILVDFRHLKAVVGQVLADFDHADLGNLEAFRTDNPTSENLARLLYGRLAAELRCETCRVSRVVVHETPGSSASYWEG
jgi:6-pyruvoyltetrahydropterin/6-carboxytetrahydropterin synthase